ncbi:hypothetical protein EGW08_009618 [Elysia chlorotica]|uniref:Gem-associated protein 5 TPR domain-containing protein n=1 Tax=Elysia chlorotica TaxID=188477 RepID=A0A433TM39_ELYCH|nr:hypothetical protein EGW08_009618 [Elysia chlorotica]
MRFSGQDPADIIDEKPHLGLYTDKLGAHRCLLQESAKHVGDGKMDYHLHLEMWRGNVAGAVQLAMQRNELSDWVVAMAPLASRETWEKVCGSYAEQLEEDGQYYKAASYLLAGHRVMEAIELFQRHGLFREAVSLAKVRLSPIDSLLEVLYMEWGTQLLKEGQFEQSAKCYLAMNQVNEAAKAVARRNDQSSLKTACHMNLIAQEQERALAYAHKALSQFLLAAQWKEAHAFLKEHEGLKVFLPVVIAHEHLVQQLSLLCPNLTLTQKPVNPESSTAELDQAGISSLFTLPEFILDKSDIDPAVPWEPLVLCGDGVARSDDGVGEGLGPLHTFPHHLIRVWHKRLGVKIMTSELKATRDSIEQLTKMRSTMMDLPNVLVMVSMDVTSCLLALLASDTSNAIQHLLQAMSVIQSNSTVCDQYKLLLPALCRLMLSQGPKYLLKLQQEFKALRVLLTMESDGDLNHAGGEGNNSIKRFLTDLKGEQTISTSSTRCRELDCLRAFYYLAVLEYLHETQKAEGCVGSPGAARGGEVFGSAQENDSLDGEPTSEGSSSGLPSSGSSKQRGSVPLSPKDGSQQEGHASVEDASHAEDLDQNGKLASAQSLVSKETLDKTNQSPGADKAKSEALKGVDKTCDDSFKKRNHGIATSTSGAKLPVASEKAGSIFPFTTSKMPKAGSESSSLDSSVDPPPVPPSELTHSKDPQKLEHPNPSSGPLSPKSQPTPTSLSPTGQQSPKKTNVVLSPKSMSPHHPSMSPRNQTPLSPHETSPSQHIGSIASSPQTPASRSSRSSTASTSAAGRRGELNKDNLMRLSRGLLWDTQAKGEVLNDTLGYIHKAISQQLLANRTPTTPTSAQAMTTTATDSGSVGAEHTSDTEGSTSASPVKSPGPVPKPGSSASPNTAASSSTAAMEPCVKTTPPLSASKATTAQPASDSLEEDGSVQQRRLATPSVSPQQGDHSSSAVKAKGSSPIQRESIQQQSSSGPTAVGSKSPSIHTSPALSQLPRSASTSTSPVSTSSPQAAASAAKQSSKPRGPARSLSESHASPTTGFDRTIGIQAERELLGELSGEPISFSNSKKVLWLDNSTKPNWPATDIVPLMLSPNGKSLRTAPAAWAEARRQAMLTPDGRALPLDWDELPVDEKFTQSYVTMTLLKRQQETIMQEMKKTPDITKTPFPSKSCSVRRLLECCIDSYHLTAEEKKKYIKHLSDWAMLFSVTTYQKSETEALFKNIPEEYRN